MNAPPTTPRPWRRFAWRFLRSAVLIALTVVIGLLVFQHRLIYLPQRYAENAAPPAGFTALEIGATILMCALPPALAFGWLLDAEQFDAALHDSLVQLHIRDAVHQQPADSIGTLIDSNRMASTI